MNKDDVIKFIDGKIFYYSDYINFLYEQLQLRDEIIKEVREYIEENLFKDDNDCGCWWYGFDYYKEAKKELLEILDKVGDNK